MANEGLSLVQWEHGLQIRHKAHSLACSYYDSRNRIIGLVSTLLTAVVATTIFASFAESESKTLITIAGIISIITTLTSAAHAFLKYGELAERHNQALASFGSLRRELETMIMDKNSPISNEKLQELNTKWTELEKNAPAIPQKIFNQASKKDFHPKQPPPSGV